MTLLKPATTNARLFAGLYGVEGAGKTYTSTTLACYARHRFGLSGPIAAIDTENGMHFRAPYVKEKTGTDLLLCETRDIDNVEPFLRECAKEGVSIAIIDSLTHILTTLRTRYFDAKGIDTPEASDYVSADRPFKVLLDKMLSARLNIILCGRESQVYGRYKNRAGRMVSGPVGTKMGAGKAGYEVDLLLHLTREESKDGVQRSVAVEKDRSDKIVGSSWGVPYDVDEKLSPYFDFLTNKGSDQ
jgi:hypothetical protein